VRQSGCRGSRRPGQRGRSAAEARILTILVGGPASALERCEPVFASFATHVVHLGDSGAGQMAKLVNNALLMINQASITDILTLTVSAGPDPFDHGRSTQTWQRRPAPGSPGVDPWRTRNTVKKRKAARIGMPARSCPGVKFVLQNGEVRVMVVESTAHCE